jgi:hypothetical protein
LHAITIGDLSYVAVIFDQSTELQIFTIDGKVKSKKELVLKLSQTLDLKSQILQIHFSQTKPYRLWAIVEDAPHVHCFDVPTFKATNGIVGEINKHGK